MEIIRSKAKTLRKFECVMAGSVFEQQGNFYIKLSTNRTAVRLCNGHSFSFNIEEEVTLYPNATLTTNQPELEEGN